jgi:lysophospholipase L1-like esterase
MALAVPATASAVDTPQPSVEAAPDTAPNDGTRILVIGDSITGNPGCWRAYMWRDLTDAGYEINMVGTRHDDECGGLTNAAGAAWDPDNTGISGITTSGMSVRVGRDGLLQRTTPEAVVMMLGTNDLMSGDDAERIMGQYEFMVDVIRRDMPEGPIVIAAPPPIAEDRCPGCQAIVDELEAGLGAWAEAKSTPDSPVFAVVHSEAFSAGTDMHDGIHPTDSGEVLIAAAITPVVMEALDYEYIPKVTPSPTTEPEPDPDFSLWRLGGALGIGLLAVVALVAFTIAWLMWRHRRGQRAHTIAQD